MNAVDSAFCICKHAKSTTNPSSSRYPEDSPLQILGNEVETLHLAAPRLVWISCEIKLYSTYPISFCDPITALLVIIKSVPSEHLARDVNLSHSFVSDSISNSSLFNFATWKRETKLSRTKRDFLVFHSERKISSTGNQNQMPPALRDGERKLFILGRREDSNSDKYFCSVSVSCRSPRLLLEIIKCQLVLM